MEANFYGFNGLDDQYRISGKKVYLYRVLREDESIEEGIFCKDKYSNRTVEQHLASGSDIGSKYISTTKSLETAKFWAANIVINKNNYTARYKPLRIVEIDIQLLAGTIYENNCINLCNDIVRNYFLKGATHINCAKGSKEVLFIAEIPKYIDLLPLLTQQGPNQCATNVVAPKMVFRLMSDLWPNTSS